VLLEQRKKGTGILLISEDLDEVMQVSDRVIVMYEGKIPYEEETDNALREVIGQVMASGEPHAAEDTEA
jgi:simple sugar transport system ATP-binding protein